MTAEPLKPCAHCGFPVEIHTNDNSLFWIECTNPECFISTLFEDQDTIIAAWNRRVCSVLDETSNQPVCLSIIPTEALKAELSRRAEPFGNPDELPDWLVERIKSRIEMREEEVFDVVTFNLINELEWVLSLKKEQNHGGSIPGTDGPD